MTYSATLDRITNEARTVGRISPARLLATIITAPFFAIGWVIGLVVVGVVLLWSAVVVGFRAGRSTSPGRRGDVGERPDGRHIG